MGKQTILCCGDGSSRVSEMLRKIIETDLLETEKGTLENKKDDNFCLTDFGIDGTLKHGKN